MPSPETRPSTNHKNLTIDSIASDLYPGFIKTTSPGQDSDSYSFSDDEIIPPTHKRRTLVLCFDGTGGPHIRITQRDVLNGTWKSRRPI
jgi:hypothetical protein